MFGSEEIPVRNIHNERLKLLSTFKTVFEQGNLVAAAEILGVTQSAVSKQVQKLRDWFEDELFIRTSNGMQPTPKALELLEKIERILEELDKLNEETHFDPSQLSGNFVLETTDEIGRRIASPLVEILSQEAPNLRLRIRRLNQGYSINELETGKVDIVISVNWHAPEQLMQQRLFSDQFVVLMGKDHTLINKKISIKNYAQARHILVAPLGQEHTFIDEILAQKGYQRDIFLTLPDFAFIDLKVLGNHSIVTLPEQIAQEVLDHNKSLAMKPLPVQTRPFHYYMFWHRRYQNDPKNRWMREQVYSLLGKS